MRAIGLTLTRNVNGFLVTYHDVPGRRCSQCETEILSRDTALALERMDSSVFGHLMHVVNSPRLGIAFYTANSPSVSMDAENTPTEVWGNSRENTSIGAMVNSSGTSGVPANSTVLVA